MQTVTNGPADAKPCRDYDPMFKLYGCELEAGHGGPHRDFRGNEWEEHLDPEPERCTSYAPWGSGYPDQRCVRGTGHDGQHRDRSGNEWGEDAAGPATAATYEGQLAERVSELLPDLGAGERLELLGAMDPEDMSTSLAWIAAMYPQVFDFAIVRDRALAGRLTTRLADDQDEDDEDEPFCRTCGAAVGIFLGHGDGWHHFRGEGTADSPVELFDAGHAPEVAWRLAGAR